MTDEPRKINPSDMPEPPRVFVFGRRLRIAMWLAFIGGPVMIAMGGYESYRTSQLRTRGETIRGTLVTHDTLATGKGRTSYHVTLDYAPPESETTFRKEFFVSKTHYEQAVHDGHIDVTYLPSDPTLSTVGDNLPFNTEPYAIGGGLLLIALGAWYFQRRQRAKVERYVMDGV